MRSEAERGGGFRPRGRGTLPQRPVLWLWLHSTPAAGISRVRGKPELSWELAGRSREGLGLSALTGPGTQEGSLDASGVLCRESLAERDKLQGPSTSPGSLALPELIFMGPIPLSLHGN